MSLVGQVLGKYRVVEQVGRGGMGTVYRAVDETLHRDVALKILNAELNDPGVSRRFRAEAVAIARLNHPGIATIFELFQHDGQWLMAIEFVRGQTLEDLVTTAGPLSVERGVDLVSQALAALGHAHGMGVVHRDLKPANLMLAESGRLKVMDFGIARVAGTEHLTSAGFLVGTPAYMSPEQVLGQEIDARTDVYAMGCVLYFLVTARLPFPGITPLELAEARIKSTPIPARTVRADLPVWLEDALGRALARDPANRHQSADAFRDALRRGLGLSTSSSTQPVIAPPPDVSETVMPGGMPVSSKLGWPPAAPPPTDEFATAETQLLRTGQQAASAKTTAAAPPAAGPTVPLRKRGTPGWLPLAAAAAIVAIVGIWWYQSRGTDQSEPPPPVDASASATPPAVPPIAPPVAPPVAPPTDPAATALSTPTATPPPATPTSTPSTSLPPGVGAGPAPRGTGSGRPGTAGADGVVTFEGVRLLKVTGRRGEDFDADLRFGSGAMVIAPRRAGADGLSLPYKELQRATFTRERNPRWVTNSTPPLAAPPANLDPPGNVFSAARRWLVLQGTTWFAILTLPDTGFEQILNTVEERTRVKIDRPGPARD